MTCSKSNCQAPATHALLLRPPYGDTIHAFPRCQEHGRADVKFDLAGRGMHGARGALVRIPAKLLASTVAA